MIYTLTSQNIIFKLLFEYYIAKFHIYELSDTYLIFSILLQTQVSQDKLLCFMYYV